MLIAPMNTDNQKTVRLFLKAAEDGSVSAQYHCGTLYVNGQGVPQDYVLAAQWYRKAADQGHAGAQHNLGGLYNGGHGVLKDYVQAAQWYRKAADQGLADAQYHLGKLYVHGHGVPQDYVQAVLWNRKAADQGYADAQYHLGLLYDNGWGVTQDYVLALHWCTIAKASGCSNPSVDQTLQELIALVTPSQIAQAEKSTREWWAAHHHGATNDTLMNMKSNTTENEMWTQTILFFVHEPMVAFKVGRYPVGKIINQFPVDERGKIKEGIDAVTELGFFVMDGGDICLTDKGEALYEWLSKVSQMSADERLEIKKAYPKSDSMLAAIERDSRLTPLPDLSAPTTNSSTTLHPDTIPGYKPLTFWNKIFLAILAIWMLLGVMKLIFRY